MEILLDVNGVCDVFCHTVMLLFRSTEEIMISICCTLPPPDINSLRPEERQLFGKLVHSLRKQGKSLQSAQELAYTLVLLESIPYEKEWFRKW
jgi:hypothetical protein